MALFKKDVLQNAEKLVQKGKIEAAIKEYKKVVARSPGDTTTLNRIGDLYVRLRKNEDAVDYYLQTAERFALDGFYVKAIAVYKKVQRIDPSAVQVHGRLADLYSKQGLINDARTHYGQLADHYLRQNDTAEAIRAYEKLVELDPENPTGLLRLADLYQEDGRTSQATAAYERIANTMIDRGQVDHAIQAYERALRTEGGNLDFVSQAVLKIRDAGGADRALDLIERAKRFNPAAETLRGLVSRPRLDPEQDLGSGSLPDLEEAVQPPTEVETTPAPPTFVPPVQEDSGSLAEDEGSSPALVDPSTFGLSDAVSEPVEAPPPEAPPLETTPEVSFEAPQVAEDDTALELDETVPQEPFVFREQGLSTLTEAPPPVPAGADLGSDGEEIEEIDLDMPEEFDLGGLGAISAGGEDAPPAPPAADVGEEPASESLPELELEDPPAFDQALGAELDAAFDRQVDPGPIQVRGQEAGATADLQPEVPSTPVSEAITTGDEDLPAAEVEIELELPSVETEHEPVPDLGDPLSAEAPVASEPLGAEPVVPEPVEPVGLDAPGPPARTPELEEKLAEAGVFRKYGLLDKALDRLNEVLAVAPGDLEALSQAIQVLVEREDEARAATKAETLLLLCAQQNERERWDEARELLESRGYVIEEDRVRTPGELSVESGSIDLQASDPLDVEPSPDKVEVEEDARDFSQLAKQPLQLEESGEHDMLDSKEIEIPDEMESVEEMAVADAVEGTPNWLDESEGDETEEASNMFEDEEDFFDLASELQDELGTDLHDLEESLPENASEQSLEEIVEGFKRGVEENIGEEESDTHYNLGIAYREMMLLDEAIHEFQISAKSKEYFVDSCAMLGVCFREKGLPDLSAKWLRRSLEAEALETAQKSGLLYDLADALEAAGDAAGAQQAFSELIALDSGFRDAADRLQRLGGS